MSVSSSPRSTPIARTYSSSMVSCGGKGSSRPKPIISQVKLPSILFMPIVKLLLKLKSSIGAFCGDSPLKFHRSISRLLAIPIEGSDTVKFGGAAVTGCVCLDVVSMELTMVLAFSAVVVGGISCVFRSVSTCSVNNRRISVPSMLAIEYKERWESSYLVVPPAPSRILS